jgi:cell division protein FtsB
MAILERENSDLKKENASLKSQITILDKENLELKKDNADLKKKIDDLENSDEPFACGANIR